jgi:hypothetical protein
MLEGEELRDKAKVDQRLCHSESKGKGVRTE